MKREFLQNLMEGMPKEVVDAIMEEHGKALQQAKQSAKDWEEKFTQAEESHKAQVAQMEFRNLLGQEISAAGGRNEKAITALLDLDIIRESQDPQAAVKAAVAAVKEENAYLFRSQLPMYAVGTGTTQPAPAKPESLAEALKEKFLRK